MKARTLKHKQNRKHPKSKSGLTDKQKMILGGAVVAAVLVGSK